MGGKRNHKNVVNVPLYIPYIYCNNCRKTKLNEKNIYR